MEQHVTFRRVAGMLVGIVIISLGVALFKFAIWATTLSTRSTSALRSLPG